MLDYFCEQVSCPEIPTICAKLGNLKRRITLGDYTTPKKEFDECQFLKRESVKILQKLGETSHVPVVVGLNSRNAVDNTSIISMKRIL